MRFYIAVIAVFLFSLGFFALQPAGAQTNPYFPLEPGLHWEYSSDMGSPPEEFVTVTGTEQFFGQTAWAIQHNYFNSMECNIEFYTIGSDGDVFLNGQRWTDSNGDVWEIVADPPFCILDMPVSPGKTWNSLYTVTYYLNGVEGPSFPDCIFTGDITVTDSPVNVPAGSFTAVEVAGTNENSFSGTPTSYSEFWYVEGSGPVRWESSIEGQPEIFIGMLWSTPMAQEEQSWGSVKALFR